MKYDFIEIGTSDFDTLLESAVSQIGISIEPIKLYLDNLPNKDTVIKLNCAITDKTGIVDIYWIDPIDLEKYGLPNWLRGCNSIINPHPSAVKELVDRNLIHLYRKTACKSLTWTDLVEQYDIKQVDYLKIDTEGHDCVIINNILDSLCILPKKILFENNVLSDKDLLEKTLKRLGTCGYITVEKGEFDILVERI